MLVRGLTWRATGAIVVGGVVCAWYSVVPAALTQRGCQHYRHSRHASVSRRWAVAARGTSNIHKFKFQGTNVVPRPKSEMSLKSCEARKQREGRGLRWEGPEQGAARTWAGTGSP
jgi:hypothetical protein